MVRSADRLLRRRLRAPFAAPAAPTPLLTLLQYTAFYEASLADSHKQLLEHELTRELLSASWFKVDGEYQGFDDFEFTIPELGVSLDAVEFAHLFGVFDRSRVHMQKEGDSNALKPVGYYVTVVNGQLLSGKNKTGIVRFDDESTGLLLPSFLFIDQFFLAGNAPERLGTLTFMLCAITAHLCGFAFIELVAAGGVGYNDKHIGYKFWPDVGFDAELFPDEAPEHLPQAVSVLDLVDADRDWWITHGSQRNMRFDLAADSRSWTKLLSYGRLKNLIS